MVRLSTLLQVNFSGATRRWAHLKFIEFIFFPLPTKQSEDLNATRQITSGLFSWQLGRGTKTKASQKKYKWRLAEGACPSRSAKKGDLAPLLQSVDDIEVICRQPAAVKHCSKRRRRKKKSKLPTERLHFRFTLCRKTLLTRAAILLKTFVMAASGGGRLFPHITTEMTAKKKKKNTHGIGQNKKEGVAIVMSVGVGRVVVET